MEGFLDTTTQYTGRKAQVGKTFLVKDRDGKERLGTFVAYCPDCKYKVLLTRSEIVELFQRYKKVSQGMREKLIRYFIKQLKYQEPYEPNKRRERHTEYVMSKF